MKIFLKMLFILFIPGSSQELVEVIKLLTKQRYVNFYHFDGV